MNTTRELLNYTRAAESALPETNEFLPSQWGACIESLHQQPHDLADFDIILLGCGERRGQNPLLPFSSGPDLVRHELFKLYNWHRGIRIADLGNLIPGATIQDTRAALKTILVEIKKAGARALILGGSHDLTLQQYDVYRQEGEITDLSIIDMIADIDDSSEHRYDNYLMETLTKSPNFIRHFNLIGFQSYFVNPQLIETFDKLRFDCIRVGKARENIEALEPALRDSGMVSMDMNAVRYSDAPANRLASPNGFYGDEMCKLTRFSGMSTKLASLGIYGYQPEHDLEGITAKLIAQMVWYFIDGVFVAKGEAPLSDRNQFLEFHLRFTDMDSCFLKSKHSNRWWMQLPDGQFMPCSHQDYITACNNEIPDRWLRAAERLV